MHRTAPEKVCCLPFFSGRELQAVEVGLEEMLLDSGHESIDVGSNEDWSF